jgi:aminoglycoside 3-N-acetyltransferase
MTEPAAVPAPAKRSLLIRELRRAGVRAGDALIVHASMKSLGWVDGGPEAVVDALLEAVNATGAASGGTLLMPAFCDPPVDAIFDPRHTPSRVGLISEAFRRGPCVSRSLHPTHSVCAVGARVDWLDGHELLPGLGVGTPLHRAALAGAKVLMLGCPITSCSLIHVAEAVARVPYLGKVWFEGCDRSITLREPDGTLRLIPPLDPPTCAGGFGVVEAELNCRRLIARPRVARAECLLFRGLDALDLAVDLLRADPSALLCDHPRCPLCPRARQSIKSSRP